MLYVVGGIFHKFDNIIGDDLNSSPFMSYIIVIDVNFLPGRWRTGSSVNPSSAR